MRKTRIFITLFVLFITACFSGAGFAQALRLETTMIEGGFDEMDFGNIRLVKDDGELNRVSLTRRMRVQVFNSSGEKYQVIQRVTSAFMSQRGTSLSSDILKFYVSGARKSGIMDPMSLTPVNTGDKVIYTSDNSGSEDTFFIDYFLSLSNILETGRYQMNVTFILTQR